MKISCVVPVYNNQKTIKRVLTVLNRSSHIDELIVVDDASKDNSREIIERFIRGKNKVVFLTNEVNQGKGATVVRGMKRTTHDHVFLCDADLSKLREEHIDQIIGTYKTQKYDMVIAARETPFEEARGFSKFLATVSGERVFKKAAVETFYDLISGLGNGIEQITNFAHRDKEVKIITTKNIGHVLKFERGRPTEWVREYVREGYQLAKTDVKLKRNLAGTVAVSALAGALFSFWFFSTRNNKRNNNKWRLPFRD